MPLTVQNRHRVRGPLICVTQATRDSYQQYHQPARQPGTGTQPAGRPACLSAFLPSRLFPFIRAGSTGAPPSSPSSTGARLARAVLFAIRRLVGAVFATSGAISPPPTTAAVLPDGPLARADLYLRLEDDTRGAKNINLPTLEGGLASLVLFKPPRTS